MRAVAAVLAVLASVAAHAEVRPGMPPRLATAGTVALYANSSTGSDSNDCLSSGTACATLVAACGKVPHFVDHPVTITVASGSSFSAGCTSQQLLGKTGSTKAAITISAPLVTATLASGTATGTATSTSTGNGRTFTTLTDSGNNWPTLGGRYFLTVAGTAYAIAYNTATVITVAGAPNLGATPGYTIQSAGATLTGNAVGTYNDNSDTTSRAAAFWVAGVDNPAGNLDLTISGFDFASGVTNGVAVWGGRVNFTNCLWSGQSSNGVIVYGYGGVRIRDSGMSASGKVLVAGDPGSAPGTISIRNTAVSGGQLIATQGPVAYHDLVLNYVDASATTGIVVSPCGSTALQLIWEQYKCGAACVDNRGCNASQPAPASAAIEAVTFTAGVNTSIGLLGVAGTGTTTQVDKLGFFGASTLDASPNANAQVAVVDQGGEVALSTGATVTPSAAGGVFCLGLIGAKCWTAAQLSGQGGMITGNDGSVVQYLTGTPTRSVQLTPVATGSLPACQAAPTGGSSTQGLLSHDSTKGRFVACDGSLTNQVVSTQRYVAAYLSPGALLLGTPAEQEVATGTTTVCTGTPSAPCVCGAGSGSPCPSNSSGITTGTATSDACHTGTGIAFGASGSASAAVVGCRVATAGKMVFTFNSFAAITPPTSVYACSCTPGF